MPDTMESPGTPVQPAAPRRVQVLSVSVPGGSSVGYGKGQDIVSGEWVEFLGDHRPMRDMGEEVAALDAATGDALVTTIEDWQEVSVEPASAREYESGLWAKMRQPGREGQIVFNGTTYQAGTPLAVIDILERYRLAQPRERLVFHLGDRATGRAWGDAEAGYVGRSTGSQRVPLVLSRAGVRGGGAISTASVVRVETARGKRVLWQHPDYHPARADEADATQPTGDN